MNKDRTRSASRKSGRLLIPSPAPGDGAAAAAALSPAEEAACCLTHSAGFLLSIAGLWALVSAAAARGDAWHITSLSVYGATLVILYAASALYHARRGPRWKRVLRTIDHSSIFLLIAGTYTPFTLVNLRGGWGWTLFGLVWGLALAGIGFKVFSRNRREAVSLAAYILMGWLAVIAARPMLELIPPGGIAWLVAGGLSYTLGAVFYALDRFPYLHVVWHLFVLAGSACHFAAVLVSVAP